MKILALIILILLIIWILYSLLSVRNLEEPKFTVISKTDGYEIRKYEPYIVAETVIEGQNSRESLNQGFRNIADYIFGNNISKEKISMTMPVTDTADISEKISMTIPVLDTGDEKKRTIAFVMPSKYTLETLPDPVTDKVTFREVPGREVAVKKYTWYTNETRDKKKAEELLAELDRDGVATAGQHTTAYYNPPLSFPLLLRNEVLVPVEVK